VDMTERKKEAEKLKDADKLELEEELELEDVTELRKEAERLDAWKKVGSGEGSGLGSGLGGGSGLELEEELELEDLTELKRKAPIFDEEEEDSLATLSSEAWDAGAEQRKEAYAKLEARRPRENSRSETSAAPRRASRERRRNA